MKGSRLAALAAALVLVGVFPQSAFALPTMIRLGYSECSACHISPQGGGPLNLYGRGIDRAQSYREGEYTPPSDGISRALTFGGRVTQDFRTVLQEQASLVNGASLDSVKTRLWPRLSYRNVTEIGKGLRVSGTVTAESTTAVRPSLSYAPRAEAPSIFVNNALVSYRATERLEFAAGRDQLPSGINVPDLGLFVRSRNRLGYYDAPAQAKMFLSVGHVRVTPFAYVPSGNEASLDDERGAGALAEVAFRSDRAVLGVSLVNGSADHGDRQMVGGYARLGFGRWGILAEHDVTERNETLPAAASFTQTASYAQLFWAAQEWLVASGIVERLNVEAPFSEKLVAGKFELAARLASQASLGVSARVQRDQITGRVSNSVMFQVSLKTVP